MNDNAFHSTLEDIIHDTFDNAYDIAVKKWKSGGIDKEIFDNDSHMPAKICLSVALLEIASNMMPKAKVFKEIAENLRRF